MRFNCETRQSLGREFVLLAPGSSTSTASFGQVLGDPSRHQQLLSQAQQLRGRIYVEDGALDAAQLSADGRYIHPGDPVSWHLLAVQRTVDQGEQVVACIRYFARGSDVSFSDLSVSRSALARSSEWGPMVREAVETEIGHAAVAGLSYVEIGGWAISEELRCTSEALQMLLSVYALGQLTGGALGLSTATTRHHSSSILKRVGGRPFIVRDKEIQAYYDPQYDCEMELLRFDSNLPNAKYSDGIRYSRSVLRQVTILLPDAAETNLAALAALHAAAFDSNSISSPLCITSAS